MSKSVCILLRRAPYGAINAAEALRHTNGAVAAGLETKLVLIDDGAYAAKENQNAQDTGWTSISETVNLTLRFNIRLPDGSPNHANIYAHKPSLEARELAAQDLVPGVAIASDDEVVRFIGDSDSLLIF